jgi:glycosyltransferase involved in cell wall biosynthesis
MALEASKARPIFIAEIEQFGGAERSLLAMSAWLYERRLPHYLLTYHDHCKLCRYAGRPLEVVELRPSGGAAGKVASLRRHFHRRGRSPWRPLVSGYQPALHATLAGLRGFHTLMHDTPSLFGDEGRRSLKGKARIAVSNLVAGRGLRSGGATIVTSRYLQRECIKDFGVAAELARMGGPLPEACPRLRPVEGRLRMLSVCRIEANKRIDWILRALRELERDQTPLSATVDWRLDIVGGGSLIPVLEALAAALGLVGRVRFHGFVSDPELAALYDRAHLFLMPAVQGYGIPAVEALGRGIPVLVHRDSGVSEILLDTPWATVMTGDEAAMVGTMREAIGKVLAGGHHAAPAPKLPTESEWAERVAHLCRWLPAEMTVHDG